MTNYIQVATTTENEADALRIAQALVEQRLAACVQVSGPVTSTYRWQGKIETGQEWRCVAKSRAELYERIEETIRQEHPYDVPEILATPILAGSEGYLRWMDEELAAPA